MPTQDERLAAVEQDLARFKTETINRYQDFAMQFTVTKALAENTIGRLAMMHNEMDQRFTKVEDTQEQHTTLLNEHTTLLKQILARLPEKPQSNWYSDRHKFLPTTTNTNKQRTQESSAKRTDANGNKQALANPSFGVFVTRPHVS